MPPGVPFSFRLAGNPATEHAARSAFQLQAVAKSTEHADSSAFSFRLMGNSVREHAPGVPFSFRLMGDPSREHAARSAIQLQAVAKSTEHAAIQLLVNGKSIQRACSQECHSTAG